MRWYTAYFELISGRRVGPWAIAARGVLALLSKIYAMGAGLKNQLYDAGWFHPQQVSVPVISIGNLTTGGTGKSPLVHWLVHELQSRGVRVGVVSRGYGGRTAVGNDEAAELRQRFPALVHVQNRDRVAACRQAIDQDAVHVIVADDGFQHRRLHRDLDIVVIDATQPWGYGACLPRGLLRESIRGMRRADLAIINRVELVAPKRVQQIVEVIHRQAPDLVVAQAITEPGGWINPQGERIPLAALRGQRLLAFAGIGNPLAFTELLQKQELNVVDACLFPDHHAYGPADIAQLQQNAETHQAEALVCTRKDLVKLSEWPQGLRPVWALDIGLKLVESAEAVQRAIDRVLEKTRRETPSSNR